MGSTSLRMFYQPKCGLALPCPDHLLPPEREREEEEEQKKKEEEEEKKQKKKKRRRREKCFPPWLCEWKMNDYEYGELVE